MEKLTEFPIVSIPPGLVVCCPPFDPLPWDEKLFEVSNLPMVQATTHSFLYIPLDMGRVMGKTQKAIDASGMGLKDRYLILSKDVSPFKAHHHFLVAGPVPGQRNLLQSGSFLTKVFEGPYQEIPRWIGEMKSFVEKEGHIMKGIWTFYTTCPGCAKKYGKNYVVLLAEI